MKKTTPLLPLFNQFINESETGKRLKKDGSRITNGSIVNYKNVFRLLKEFTESSNFNLRICDVYRLTQRELISEKNYWKKFYRKFTDFMYQKGCYDNYVGANIKQIRTFILYLKTETNHNPGDFYQQFYVRKENVQILVLNPEQLKFLIHDKNFELRLTPSEKVVKDIFVFGCATALRFSDIFSLKENNFEEHKNQWYLRLKSQKTKTLSSMKLPRYAVEIYLKYRSTARRQAIFNHISQTGFNENLKCIGEKAKFIDLVDVTREQRGKPITILKSGQKQRYRFCDKMSSHMMRRTAITTMLILGMPEHLVRNISGHSANSNSFYRYVHFAQPYLDKEIEKVHAKLDVY